MCVFKQQQQQRFLQQHFQPTAAFRSAFSACSSSTAIRSAFSACRSSRRQRSAAAFFDTKPAFSSARRRCSRFVFCRQTLSTLEIQKDTDPGIRSDFLLQQAHADEELVVVPKWLIQTLKDSNVADFTSWNDSGPRTRSRTYSDSSSANVLLQTNYSLLSSIMVA